MDKPWFDPKTGVLMLDEYVAEMPSFKKIMADNVVTDDEILSHANRVSELLHQMEAALPADVKPLATEALCELAVLYAINRMQGV